LPPCHARCRNVRCPQSAWWVLHTSICVCNDRMPHAEHAWEVITDTLLMCTLWGPTQPATVSIIQLQYKLSTSICGYSSVFFCEGRARVTWGLHGSCALAWVQLGISGGVMSAVGNQWRCKQHMWRPPLNMLLEMGASGSGGFKRGRGDMGEAVGELGICVMRRNQG
jgi:hypothetical protein